MTALILRPQFPDRREPDQKRRDSYSALIAQIKTGGVRFRTVEDLLGEFDQNWRRRSDAADAIRYGIDWARPFEATGALKTFRVIDWTPGDDETQ